MTKALLQIQGTTVFCQNLSSFTERFIFKFTSLFPLMFEHIILYMMGIQGGNGVLFLN